MSYLAFVDESGTPGLDGINPASPHFTLTAALYQQDDYLLKELPQFAGLKHRFFGHEGVILRSYDIRKKEGPFSICKEPFREDQFRTALSEAFLASPAMLIAAVIDKAKHRKRYITPTDPYDLAMSFIVERIYREIQSPCRFIFESRGKKEDRIVEGWFRQIVAGDNIFGCGLPFQILFSRKKDNVLGIQVADLACWPIIHYVKNGENVRPDWLAVRSRIRSRANGAIAGYGLKSFP